MKMEDNILKSSLINDASLKSGALAPQVSHTNMHDSAIAANTRSSTSQNSNLAVSMDLVIVIFLLTTFKLHFFETLVLFNYIFIIVLACQIVVFFTVSPLERW